MGAVVAYESEPPPQVIKYQGRTVQETYKDDQTWHYYDEGGQWVTVGDDYRSWKWPKVDKVDNTRRVNLVIWSIWKPDRLTIMDYPRIGSSGAVRGKAEPIRYHLYPIKSKNGRVSKWGAYFKLRDKGQHYLVIKTRWERDPGTQHSYGTGEHLAHLKSF